MFFLLYIDVFRRKLEVDSVNFIKRSKSLLFVIIVSMVFVLTIIIVGKVYQNSQIQNFNKNGYVVVANEQAESQKYNFTSETQYREKFGGIFKFEDVQEETVEISEDHFLHFEDGSFSAFTNGVVLNINDVQSEKIINHYGIEAKMSMDKTSKGYQIKNANDPVELEEVFWKISEDKYLVASEALKVVFNDKDQRDAGEFIELNYIDEGVVQMVTKDNVWQTISGSAYIQTAQGNKIRLSDQQIESGDEILPFSKLVIHSDDNVELTPEEIKDLKVPEFNIESEDGQEGEKGTEGTAGENGNHGQQGGLGQEGEIGEDGFNGENGTNGVSGESGNKGSNGEEGKDGATGATGSKGPGASNDTAGRTEIPYATIASWDVTATSLKGSVLVKDELGRLEEVQNPMMTFSIYEAATGKLVENCINPDDANGQFIPIGKEDPYKFELPNGVELKPDTEYRFVVHGKYALNDSEFERELISRIFYTDSLGIFLEKKDVTTNTLRMTIERKNYSQAQGATVYLLTEDQVKSFDPNGSQSYPYYPVTFDDKEIYEVKFDDKVLQPNTSYVARVVLTLDGDKKYLTEQVVRFKTLKRAPEFIGEPYVITNRKEWAFELYNGKIDDLDKGIIGYRYEIYTADDSELVRSIEVQPNHDSAVFAYLGSNIEGEGKLIAGEKYNFKVITLFNDNEKIIEYTSDDSPPFAMQGTQLPALVFEAGENAIQPDRIGGTLRIVMNGSKIQVPSTEHPIIITIENEGSFKQEFRYESENAEGLPPMKINSGTIEISLNEIGLKADTIYRISAIASVDVGDGNDYQPYSIGHIVETTPSYPTITADWNQNVNYGTSLGVDLQLTGLENNLDHANKISRIVLNLYNGAGEGKQFIGEHIIEDENPDKFKSTIVDKIINKPYKITEQTFNKDSAEMQSTTYTIEVKAVYDYTVNEYKNPGNIEQNGGYKNQFTVLENSEILNKSVQPPILAPYDKQNEQVEAVVVKNEDAGKYGLTVDETLDDETIIGFALKTKYDNYSQLAREITYYAFEADQYQTLVDAGTNPTKTKDAEVYKATFKVDSASTAMPKTVFVFGNGKPKDGADKQEDFLSSTGWNIQFTGETDYDSEKLTYTKGMGRGWKYVFANTIVYNEKNLEDESNNRNYPEQAPNYDTVSGGKVYVLNSGIQSAPKSNPIFVSYPTSTSTHAIEFKYKYSDPDGTITPKATWIQYENIQEHIENPLQWNTMKLEGITNTIVKSISPVVYRNLYFKNSSNANINPSKIYDQNPDSPDNKMNIFTLPFSNVKTLTDDEVMYSLTTELKEAENKLKVSLIPNGTPSVPIVGVEFIFASENNNTVFKKILKPERYNKEHYIEISTAELSVFKEKNEAFTVSANVYYDTGQIVWTGAMTTDPAKKTYYAQQLVTEEGELGKYVTTTNGVSENPEGSMIDIMQFPEFEGAAETSMYRFKNLILGSNEITNQVVALNGGLATYSNEQVYDIRVLKKLAKFTIEDTEKIEINHITPSVSMGHSPSRRYFDLNNIKIYAQKEIAEETINGETGRYIEIVVKDEQGNKIHFTDTNTTIGNGKDIVIAKDENDKGRLLLKLKENQESYHIRIGNNTEDSVIKASSKYTVEVHAKIGDDVIPILDNASGKKFNREINTQGNVKVSNVSHAYYKGISYQEKTLDFEFNLSQLSGYHLELDLYEEDGTTPIYTFQELKELGIIKSDIQNSSKEKITFKVRNEYRTVKELEGQDPLIEFHKNKIVPNKSYVLKIKAIDDADHKNIAEGQNEYTFHLESLREPGIFLNMAPLYENQKIKLETTFTVGDEDKVIMGPTDYETTPITDKYGEYIVRLYEQQNNQWVDVTTEKVVEKVFTINPEQPMQQLEFDNTINDAAIKSNTNYRFVLYAKVDKNHNGIDDVSEINNNAQLNSGSISEVKPDDLEKYEIFSVTRRTPGKDGYAIGNIGLTSGQSRSKIQVTHANASGLEKVQAVEYTVVHSSGLTSYSGVIEKEANQSSLFTSNQDIPGYYTLDLPMTLSTTGSYQVIIKYTDKTGQNIGEYSNIYTY